MIQFAGTHLPENDHVNEGGFNADRIDNFYTDIIRIDPSLKSFLISGSIILGGLKEESLDPN